MLPRIGLIGVGALGCEHYYNLIDQEQNGNLNLTCLCDVDETLLQAPGTRISAGQARLQMTNIALFTTPEERTAALHQCRQAFAGSLPRMYTNYEAMLEKEQLDGVIVGIPNYQHKEVTLAALKRNVHVLCEKPMASTLDDCRAMMEAEKQSDAFIQVGLHRRYNKFFRFVADMLHSGRLGDLKTMWGQEFRGDWAARATPVATDRGTTNWRFSRKHAGGSLQEKICHDFDVFNWWAGALPSRVTAMGDIGIYRDGRDTLDHAQILFEYENGIQGWFALSMFCRHGRFKGRYMGIIGADGSLDFDSHNGECTVYQTDGRREEHTGLNPPNLPIHHPGQATYLELGAFLKCIETAQKPYADSTVGLHSLLAPVAAQLSIDRGGETIYPQTLL